MRTIAAFTLLVAYTLASPGPSGGYGGPAGSGYGHGPAGGGYGHGPAGGSYGPYYSPAELNAAAELAHRVANEKEFLASRLATLRDQQEALMDALDDIANATGNLSQEQDRQNSELDGIRAAIKQKLHDIGDLEADLAGEVALAQRLVPFTNAFRPGLTDLRDSNANQDAQLARIQRFLDDADDKLDEKLTSATARADDSIDEVQETVKAVANLVNTKLCSNANMHVKIDAETAVGRETVDFTDPFGDITPVAFCALQGFVTDLKLDQTQYGYGYGHHSQDQNIAVAIDCRPSAGSVEVAVFDQSQGTGNGIHSVFVVVKACSLGPVA